MMKGRALVVTPPDQGSTMLVAKTLPKTAVVAAAEPCTGQSGTRWEDVPEDWLCPDCGVGKLDFEMIEMTDDAPEQDGRSNKNGRYTRTPMSSPQNARCLRLLFCLPFCLFDRLFVGSVACAIIEQSKVEQCRAKQRQCNAT